MMKDIKGYEGLYAITADGQVWSYRSQRYLTPSPNANGYLRVNLYKDKKPKNKFIHRLVAAAYIPNPNNLPEINHISEDKTDNKVENLEWCDRIYNLNYGTRKEKAAKSHYKAVYCVELNTTFESQKAAAETNGIAATNIAACCKGKRQTAGGYHWRYAE